MPTTANAIRRAAEILRAEAECLRECHAPRDDWTGEAEAQADHDEWIALADQLEALTAAPPAPVAAGWIRVEDRLPNLHESVVLIDINRWENTPGDLQMNVGACGYLAEVGPVKYWSIRGERATTLDAFTHWALLVPPSPEAEVRHG